MSIKCDTCNHIAVSDERDVGAGYVEYCNEGHWGGECEDNSNDGYCTYRDGCIDYELKRVIK
ncbi:hypothetical protein [Clostridium estertheticum]|uniref:hypothetical protein n=1 Tax=Clostridium estertheticum TaxID=238834 RepID=UPI001C0E6B11|nr:hypothetical protein [Clostridium estertheticum]MBU3186559.1 hypothetical protein [Clostridium estertheticum]